MSLNDTLLERHQEVLTEVEAGRVNGASRALTTLIGRAERGGLAQLVPKFRLTLAWVELDRGRLAACRAQLATIDSPDEADRTKADCLAALSRCAAGEHSAAIPELSAAITSLRQLDERRWLANALVGRGTAHGYLHQVVEADMDFAAAHDLYTDLGEQVRAAACVHNRGFVAAQAGDLPLALRYFSDAEADGLPVERHPEVLIDRAQVLVAAGLATSARPVVARAVSLLKAAGRGTKLAEATLALAQCAWRAGQLDIAAETAARAAELFQRQGRNSWRPAAKAVELLATQPASTARRVAAACDRHGWWLAAAELRLAAGIQLAEVAARRDRGPAVLRALGWLARAQNTTDRRAVLAACRAGLRVVRRDMATMAAWELQAGAAGHVAQLAHVGLRAALESRRPRTILRWADECRSVAGPPVLPPADPVLAERLVALRAAIASGGSPTLIRRLEQRVRAQEWTNRGVSKDQQDWTFKELVDRLGSAALVTFINIDDSRLAVSVVDGRCLLHPLGKASAIDTAVRALQFARHSAIEVDDALFGPLANIIGDRPLVVVPDAGTHAIPWGVLPSCVGRAVSVVPSIRAWTRSAPTTGERVWVAGPRLRYGCREVRALHNTYGGHLLTGRQATVARTLSALDGAELVHVAAHGRFRADQPLFSAVELADGPLFAYDVQRLHKPPRLVVLSACDTGRSVVRPGGDVLGLATALLRSGASTVIASVQPVPDRQAVELMTALHEGLRDGRGPAEALARAQVRHGQQGFVCFGAG